MTEPTPPVLICDHPDDLPRAAETLAAAGWALRPGFALPEEPWDLTRRKWACHGAVRNAEVAQAATLALIRGCAVIVATGDGVPAEFRADLARAGRVELFSRHRGDEFRLDPVETALLELLADGQSVQQAAAALYLSGRTAQRRLASARAALGVRTTRETVVVWTRLHRGSSPGG